jgi:hypothetical protein
MSKRTRLPKTIEEAHAEIDKAVHEINTAQERIRKACNLLVHEGNTVSHTSAESHYAVAVNESHRDFTQLRLTMGNAWKAYKEEQQS